MKSKNAIIRRRTGRPPKHGIYSLAARSRLLEKDPEIKLYALAVRDEWIAELVEANGSLTASQKVLVDRANSKLVLLCLIENALGENGIWRRDLIQSKMIFDVEPCLTQYGALDNALRKDLQLLGIERKAKAEDGLAALHKYIGLEQASDGTYAEPAPKVPEEASQDAPEAITEAPEAKDEGVS
jgi:hypothetical protein